jgi:hypothetical protein
MPTATQRAALTARMTRRLSGLAAAEGPTAEFVPTPQGWVWGGVSGLGGNAADEALAARRAFVRWLKRAYPGVVEQLETALEAVELERELSGVGQAETEEGSWLDKLIGAAQQILPAYLQYEQQREVLDIQLERARAGLPPLETGQYAPSVQVGLDPETVRRLGDEAMTRASAAAQGVFAGPWPWILLGVGGIALVAMQGQGRRRRR